MNEIADSIIQMSYSPAINVYLVWILGIYSVWKLNSMFKKDVNELSESEKGRYKQFIKDGKWSVIKMRLTALFMIPFLGMVNDFIFVMIGGPKIAVYSKLWWGQFLSLDTILSFF